MSKYNLLWQYIQKSNQNSIVLTFDEIKNILGFKIDHSFLNYKKELKDFGYQVDKISLKNQKIQFIKLTE